MDFSAGSMIANLLVSSVGYGFFIYGKKQGRFPQLTVGIALMGYPYLVGDPAWMAGIGVALVVGLWVAVRAGL